MITMKFGGTSVQDAAAMSNVVRIVREHLKEQPLVIISAVAQGTNVLERAGKLSAEGKQGEARDGLLKLFDRHYAIVDELIKDSARHRELRKIIAGSLSELDELMKGVSILRELTPRTLDTFYSYGELLSSRIIAAALQEAGVDAVWLDTKVFMTTDENFNRAMPVMDMVEARLNTLARPLIEQGKVPVTQGFIGMTSSGFRTTMGRESSDYSAAIIGVAMHVREIQIWTDVDGVLTADPRVVQNPRKVKVLSFEEAFELSYFGAKVLHPNTMLPAHERNIPIRILNSRKPQFDGTVVMSNPSAGEQMVKSVASRKNIVLLTVSPAKRYSQYIFWEHIYSVLTKHGAVAALTSTSEYNVAIALDTRHPIDAIVADLSGIGTVDVQHGKGIVCVVGKNLRNAPALMGRIFQSLGEIGVAMMSFGSSASSVNMVLDETSVEEAVRRIHRHFFEESSVADDGIFEKLEASVR